jgi:hypothetical protein
LFDDITKIIINLLDMHIMKTNICL